jgi:hypothetical protein
MTCCGCAFTPTRRDRPQFYCCTSHRWLWWEFRRIQVQELALFDRDSYRARRLAPDTPAPPFGGDFIEDRPPLPEQHRTHGPLGY